MTKKIDIISFTGISTFEIAILLLITGYLSYLVLRKKEAILSSKGRDVVYENMATVKLGVLFSLVSMLFFLEAETAEIISVLFPTTFSVDLISIHRYAEILHLFLLILGLLFFLSVLSKAGEE